MLNMNLINTVVREANYYCEAEGIMETNQNLYRRAIDWYNNTDITDVHTLSALVLWGEYRPLSYSEISYIRDLFYADGEEIFA